MRPGMANLAARLLAVGLTGFSASFGQDAGDEVAPRPRTKQAAAPARSTEVPGQAQSPAPPVRNAPLDPAKMERLLQLWEGQSSKLKTLDVTIFRTDTSAAWGGKEFYEGRAIFKSPNLAFIDFKTIEKDANGQPARDARTGKYKSADYERIICTGEEVWQYKTDTQQVFIFPLPKDQQKKAIEEGPLPFLFNMRADEARKRYQMTLVSEDAKGYGVSIKPRLPDDKESFSLALVRLDAKYLLPVRIILFSPDNKDRKDFELRPIFPNAKVNDKNFQGRPLGAPWKVVRNPAGEERPKAGMGRTTRRGPGAEAPALRQGSVAPAPRR